MVEKGNKKVFFTGDVAWIEKAELEKLPQVNLNVTEASYIKKGGHINRTSDKIYGHTGVPNLIRSLTPYTQKILLSHYCEWFFEYIPKAIEYLKGIAPKVVKIIAAHDGMLVQI